MADTRSVMPVSRETAFADVWISKPLVRLPAPAVSPADARTTKQVIRPTESGRRVYG